MTDELRRRHSRRRRQLRCRPRQRRSDVPAPVAARRGSSRPRHRAALGAVDHRPARGDRGELRLEHAGPRRGSPTTWWRTPRPRRSPMAASQRAVLGLLEVDPERAWRADGSVYAMALGEGEVQIEIEDEDGKIDLNAAPLELLAGLLARARAWRPSEAQAMADRIGDYRDEDTSPSRRAPRTRTISPPGAAAGAADRAVRDRERAAERARHDAGAVRAACGPTSRSIPAPRASIRRARRAPCSRRCPGMTPELIEALPTRGAASSTRSPRSRTRSLLERARDLLPADRATGVHDSRRSARTARRRRSSCARR